MELMLVLIVKKCIRKGFTFKLFQATLKQIIMQMAVSNIDQ